MSAFILIVCGTKRGASWAVQIVARRLPPLTCGLKKAKHVSRLESGHTTLWRRSFTSSNSRFIKCHGRHFTKRQTLAAINRALNI